MHRVNRYAILGLKCNPYAAALAEEMAGDPCRLPVAGEAHRRLVAEIAEAAARPGSPRLFLVTGPWGVGKTTVAVRAACEMARMGLDPLRVHVYAAEVRGEREPYAALALRTVEGVRSNARNPIPEGELAKRYPRLAAALRGARLGCGDLRAALAEAAAYTVRQLLEERRPLYIVYDQFEALVESNPECVGLLHFTVYYLKEAFHAAARAAERGYKPRLVVVEALHSSMAARYHYELARNRVSLVELLGNVTARDLRPFRSHAETGELLDLYATEGPCGSAPRPLFDQAAVRAIHDYSRGLPRSIVRLAAQAVEEAAATAARPPLGAGIVHRAIAQETLGPIALECAGREREALEEAGAWGQGLPRLLRLALRAYATAQPEGVEVEPLDGGGPPRALLVDVHGRRAILAAVPRRATRPTLERLISLARRHGAGRVVVLTHGGPAETALALIARSRREGPRIVFRVLPRDRAALLAAACLAVAAQGDAEPEDVERILSALVAG